MEQQDPIVHSMKYVQPKVKIIVSQIRIYFDYLIDHDLIEDTR